MYSHHSDNGTNTASHGHAGDNVQLLEVDGWELVKAMYPNLVGVNSYPYHIKCNGGVYREDNENGIKALTCIECGEAVPKEIQGLWKLHNWEEITGV